jgi:hypothetical protein
MLGHTIAERLAMSTREEREMSGVPFDERDEAPTVEVRVYQHGTLVHQQLCESEEQAELTIDAWSELEGMTCEVDDLSVRHATGDIFEAEPIERRDEEYAEQLELDARPRRND